jgi:hypothetical protein
MPRVGFREARGVSMRVPGVMARGAWAACTGRSLLLLLQPGVTAGAGQTPCRPLNYLIRAAVLYTEACRALHLRQRRCTPAPVSPSHLESGTSSG